MAVLSRSGRADGAQETLQGDITQPRLGLGRAAYDRLASDVELIVNAAGSVDLRATPEQMRQVNVDGVSRLVELARDASCGMIHVSTAYVSNQTAGLVAPTLSSGATLLGMRTTAQYYVATKQAGEAELERNGPPQTVIVRPSVVVGDTRSGSIPSFQGIYSFAAMILRGRVPAVPLDGSALIDVVPRDVVGKCVAALARRPLDGGVYWLTAGERAPTASEVVDCVVEVGRERGLDVDPPRFVSPDVIERLLRPAFYGLLPTAKQRRFDYATELTDVLTVALESGEALPTSVAELLSTPELPFDPRAVLGTALRYWARARGLGRG